MTINEYYYYSNQILFINDRRKSIVSSVLIPYRLKLLLLLIIIIVSIINISNGQQHSKHPNDYYDYDQPLSFSDTNIFEHGSIDNGKSIASSSPSLTTLCDRYNYDNDGYGEGSMIGSSNGGGGIHALGMESEMIPDTSLTASSAFEMLHVGPQNARLNKDKSGGAWCPSKQLGPETSGSEWIQIALDNYHVITGIATQGRYGKGLGQEFTEWYTIYYSREEQSPNKWIKWKSLNGFSNLQGNSDTNTIVRQHLSIPIVAAKYLRIVPISNHTRTVCLRFELYGCIYQGPISYTIPASHEHILIEKNLEKLLDLSYDGIKSLSNGIWSNGLGQLIDGIKSTKSFTSSHNSFINAAIDEDYFWVGWPRIISSDQQSNLIESSASSVTMSFEFDNIYNFTDMTINCRRSEMENLNCFQNIFTWFSLDHQQWSHSVEYQTIVSNVNDYSQDILIPLRNRIGRYVRIELIYQSEWLQLSEITFQMNPLKSKNLTIEQINKLFNEWTPTNAYASSSSASYNNDNHTSTKTSLFINHQIDKNKFTINHSNQNKINRNVDTDNQTLKYSLIIACLCILALIIISLLTSIMYKKFNIRKMNNIFSEISTNQNSTSHLNNSNLISNQRLMNHNNITMKDMLKDVNFNGDGRDNNDDDDHHSNGGGGSPLYYSPKEIAIIDESEYAIPDVICTNNNSSIQSKTLKSNLNNDNRSTIICKTINPRFYASSDIIEQSIYGNRIHAVHPPIRNIINSNCHIRTLMNNNNNINLINNQWSFNQPLLMNTFNNQQTIQQNLISNNDLINGHFGVRIFDESEIGVIQNLGKSRFGDVLLCTISAIVNNNIPSSPAATAAVRKSRLVIVRTVNNLSLKNEFIDELNEKQRKFQNPELFLRLFGIIDNCTYFASITEYGDCDLNYYLRKTNILSMETILSITKQIVSACLHLESIKQQHRDLAARNIIVFDPNSKKNNPNQTLTIKLSDGLAVDLDQYADDYYNHLPIRWMSPQSIVTNTFDKISEIYSFGICFWEILTKCKQKPFQQLSDDEYLEMIYDFIENQQPLIELPMLLPFKQSHKDIDQLLHKCIEPNPEHRPQSFQEIMSFIQRKMLQL